MTTHFDDELPERLPLPKPSGWFEVFCCTGIILTFAALLAVLALLR